MNAQVHHIEGEERKMNKSLCNMITEIILMKVYNMTIMAKECHVKFCTRHYLSHAHCSIACVACLLIWQVCIVAASSPGPALRGEAWYTLFAHGQYILLYFLQKNFVHLFGPYVEDHANQQYKAFFKIDSSSNLICKILLE